MCFNQSAPGKEHSGLTGRTKKRTLGYPGNSKCWRFNYLGIEEPYTFLSIYIVPNLTEHEDKKPLRAVEQWVIMFTFSCYVRFVNGLFNIYLEFPQKTNALSHCLYMCVGITWLNCTYTMFPHMHVVKLGTLNKFKVILEIAIVSFLGFTNKFCLLFPF